MSTKPPTFKTFAPAGSSVPANAFIRLHDPKVAAFAGIAVSAALAWAFLVLVLAGMANETSLTRAGPGMAVFEQLFGNGNNAFLRDLFLAICAPARLTPALSAQGGIWTVMALSTPMWLVMVFAMMLPAAGPMVKTYVEIAQTARAKGIATVSPMVLAAGYLTVWAGFCLAAATLQALAAQAALLDDGLVINHPAIAGSILAAAGLYQLSPLRQACLVKCRSPLPLFLTHWSNTPSGVFKMGAVQGLSCVLCCWALMLVMFSAGLMNLVWMAIASIVLLLEKTLARPAGLTWATGLALLAWAAAIFAGTWV